MPSVIIAAHNEEAVIGDCLQALLDDPVDDLEVIVSANACSDGTARIARSAGVAVVERDAPGKAAALNAAELVAHRFPRVYLDADIVLPPGSVSRLVARISHDTGLHAVVPARRVNLDGRPWPVRAYFEINTRLPVFRSGLFGRGCIVLSEAGRSRFEAFPELIADDLFLDSQFADSEKAEVGEVTVVVEAPWTTRDLLRRLVRVRRGNAELRRESAGRGLGVTVRAPSRWSWLTEVVAKRPTLAPAGLVYAALSFVAAARAARPSRNTPAWGRDESTRGGRDGRGGAPR